MDVIYHKNRINVSNKIVQLKNQKVNRIAVAVKRFSVTVGLEWM